MQEITAFKKRKTKQSAARRIRLHTYQLFRRTTKSIQRKRRIARHYTFKTEISSNRPIKPMGKIQLIIKLRGITKMCKDLL